MSNFFTKLFADSDDSVATKVRPQDINKLYEKAYTEAFLEQLKNKNVPGFENYEPTTKAREKFKEIPDEEVAKVSKILTQKFCTYKHRGINLSNPDSQAIVNSNDLISSGTIQRATAAVFNLGQVDDEQGKTLNVVLNLTTDFLEGKIKADSYSNGLKHRIGYIANDFGSSVGSDNSRKEAGYYTDLFMKAAIKIASTVYEGNPDKYPNADIKGLSSKHIS